MKIRIKHPIYGVPITYFSNYCSDQFKIIMMASSFSFKGYKDILDRFGFNPNIKYKGQGGLGVAILGGKGLYGRFLIRKS